MNELDLNKIGSLVMYRRRKVLTVIFESFFMSEVKLSMTLELECIQNLKQN